MQKYKINYVINNKILSTLYVKSKTYPKIPNFDNQKYYILEQTQVEEKDICVICVLLAPKLEIFDVDVYFQNKYIGVSKISVNNVDFEHVIENKFTNYEDLEKELQVDKNFEFFGCIPRIGYKYSYDYNNQNQSLKISLNKITFNHTTGELYLDENNQLKGLVADNGYVICKLELKDNNQIEFEIKQLANKKEILSKLQEHFEEEEFIKTNKLLINKLLDENKKTITKQNLDYFKTQIKKSPNVQEIITTNDISQNQVDEVIDKQATALINDVIEEVLENKENVETKVKKNGFFTKLFSKTK